MAHRPAVSRLGPPELLLPAPTVDDDQPQARHLHGQPPRLGEPRRGGVHRGDIEPAGRQPDRVAPLPFAEAQGLQLGDTFKALIADFDCEPQPGGHLYIAHKPGAMAALENETEVCNRVFGYKVRMLDADTVKNEATAVTTI